MSKLRIRASKLLALCLVVILGVCGCAKSDLTENSSGETVGKTTGDTAGKTAEEISTAEIQHAEQYVPQSDEDDEAAGENVIINLADQNTSVSGSGVSVDNDVITISKGGNYTVYGSLNDGQLVVSATKDDKVSITFSGVSITNPDDAAIYIEKADKTVIILEENTENTIISGEKTEINEESADNCADASGAAITSKDDLTIKGEGTLNVYGYINNGINCSNDLKIKSGNINITAANNGIKSKETILISGGEVTVLAGNDGIKAEEETETEQFGTITLEAGKVNVECYGDAISALCELIVVDGEYNILTGGGAVTSGGGMPGSDFVGMMPEGGFGGEMPSGEMPEGGFDGEMPSGEMPEGGFDGEMPSGEMPGGNMTNGKPNGGGKGDFSGQGNFGDFGGRGQWTDRNSGWDMSSEDSKSMKGLKAGNSMIIYGGTIVINSYDDSIHSNDSIIIEGGNFSLSSSDDGIHADKSITINGGNIDITDSYEGIEANRICVNEGVISVCSSDDGFNANGGSSSWGNFGSTSSNTVTDMPNLIINGGTILVNARGDGLDSNGNITVNGGYVIVDGPSDSGNGALDCGTEIGGVCSVNGGTVLAVGASGMAECFDSTSTQVSFSFTGSTSFKAGDVITITDSDNNVLISYECIKGGNNIVFSCDKLSVGSSYTISYGSTSQTVSIDSVAPSNSGGFGNMKGNGGRK